LEIATEIEAELQNAEISQKGLLRISQALDNLLSVRLMQFPDETDPNYNYDFAKTFSGNQVQNQTGGKLF